MLQLDWANISYVHALTTEAILKKHPELFRGGLNILYGMTAKICTDPDVIFFKSWSIPYTMHHKVNQEIDQFHAQGIIEPV